MTQKQKKWLAIGTIAILIILLLFSRRGSSTVINNASPIQMGNVDIPGVNLAPRGNVIISIPGLPNDNPYNFNAISPCMCNPNASPLSSNTGPSITFETVTNEAAQGPTIYNYNTTNTTQPNPWAGFEAYAVTTG